MAMPPSAAQPVAAVHGPAVAGQPTKQVSRSFSSRFGQQGAGARPMTARPTGMGTSYSQGGSNIGAKMSSSSPSQMISKMSDTGRAAMNAPKAPAVAAATRGLGMVGTVARVAANPLVGGVAAAMTPTPAGETRSEKDRQAAYGQSLPNVAPGQGSTKNIAPVSGGSIAPNAGRTSTPVAPKQTFSQAFAAARSKAAEIGAKSTGTFEYGSKKYQTNLAPAKGSEKYVAPSKQTDTGVKAEPTNKPVDVPLPPSRPSDLGGTNTTAKATTDNTPSNAQTQTSASATSPKQDDKVKASVTVKEQYTMKEDRKKVLSKAKQRKANTTETGKPADPVELDPVKQGMQGPSLS